MHPNRRTIIFVMKRPRKNYEYIALVEIQIIASGCFVKNDLYNSQLHLHTIPGIRRNHLDSGVPCCCRCQDAKMIWGGSNGAGVKGEIWS